MAKPYALTQDTDNAREGFFDGDKFRAVYGRLADDLKPVAMFGYITGWRKGEVLGLQWRQVDFQGGSIRLHSLQSKNKKSRQFPMARFPRLRALLEAQRDHTRAIERAESRTIPHVFHRGGEPIRIFRRAWLTAYRGAGVPGMHFHDLRRSAVRNLVRAGVPERVAMTMTGHKTRSVFDRYDITSGDDLDQAAERLSDFMGKDLGKVAKVGARRIA